MSEFFWVLSSICLHMVISLLLPCPWLSPYLSVWLIHNVLRGIFTPTLQQSGIRCPVIISLMVTQTAWASRETHMWDFPPNRALFQNSLRLRGVFILGYIRGLDVNWLTTASLKNGLRQRYEVIVRACKWWWCSVSSPLLAEDSFSESDYKWFKADRWCVHAYINSFI